MRIPLNTLRTQHLRTYGSGDLEDPMIGAVAGCPAVYKAKYVDHSMVEPRSFPLEYGSMLHDVLFIAEEEGLPLLPDALAKAWGRTELPLGPEAFEEATDDLTKFIERGGLNLSTLAVEQELTMPLCTIDGQEYSFGGRLDWIGVNPEEEDVLYVGDYKTDRSPSSQAKIDSDAQFIGYMILARHNCAKWGFDPETVRIVMIGEYIKWNTLYTTREPWQEEQYLDWLRAMCMRIVKDEAGDPVLNDSCNWCPLKFDCKEFRKLPGEGATLADRMSKTTDLAQRVYLMQQGQLVFKGLKAMIEEVQAELKSSVGEDGQVFNGLRYAASPSLSSEYDKPALHKLLGDAGFYGITNVTQKALDAVIKRRPELRAGIEGCITKVPSGTVRLSTTKAGGDDSF